jgi:hypothetical protein
MDGLLEVLSEKIVVHTDGGDRISAARHPIVGPDKVARHLLGLQRSYAHGSRDQLIQGRNVSASDREEARRKRTCSSCKHTIPYGML